MGAEDKDADGIGTVLIYRLLYRYYVSQGFAHLLFAKLHHAVMQPVFNKRLNAGETLRLGNLILMVGKDQVLSAAVDINTVTKILKRHGAAFNVPPRSTRTPGAIPARLTGL